MSALLADSYLPSTQAWREGDDPGERLFVDLGLFTLESGEELPVTMAYETWGTLNADRSNAVLIVHALTGDSHVVGEASDAHPTAGWWDDVVGPGKAIDTNRWFVVAPNILGGCQGTTGPASLAPDGVPWGSRFPWLTARDQAAAEAQLSDALGIDRYALIIGGSMGGQRALEWAVMFPERVEKLCILASNAATTPHQIAIAHTQLLAIENDPEFCGGDYYDLPKGRGPYEGLALARQIAHITYRSGNELSQRFSRRAQGNEKPLEGGRYAVESYVDHAGEKLVRRFDANSYRVITRAMMTHDVGRGRGGIANALGQVTADVLVIGVDSDELFRPDELEAIAAHVPNARPLVWITSNCGHDGFLNEHEEVSRALREFL